MLGQFDTNAVHGRTHTWRHNFGYSEQSKSFLRRSCWRATWVNLATNTTSKQAWQRFIAPQRDDPVKRGLEHGEIVHRLCLELVEGVQSTYIETITLFMPLGKERRGNMVQACGTCSSICGLSSTKTVMKWSNMCGRFILACTSVQITCQTNAHGDDVYK